MNRTLLGRFLVASTSYLFCFGTALGQSETKELATDEIANQILQAYRAEDQSVVNGFLDSGQPDLFPVADQLLGWHIEAVLQEPPQSSDFLDAAGWMATLAGKNKATEKLKELVAKWEEMSQATLRREAELRSLARGVRKAESNRNWQEVITLLEKSDPALATEGISITAVRLHLILAYAYQNLFQLQQANTAFEKVVEKATHLGWHKVAAFAKARSGLLDQEEGNLNQALATWKECLLLNKKIGDHKATAATSLRIGNTQFQLAEYKQSLEAYQNARDEHKTIGDHRAAAWILGNIGNTYRELGRHALALETLGHAKSEMQHLGDRKGESWILRHIGQTHHSLGEYSKALEAYRRAHNEMQAIGEFARAVKVLGNIGIIYLNEGKYAKALETFEHVLKELQRIGDYASIIRALGNIGNTYMKLGNHTKALEIFERAYSQAIDMNDFKAANAILKSKGMVYFALDDHAKALESFESVLQEAQDHGARSFVANTLSDIAIVQASSGNYEIALETFERAIRESRDIGDLAAHASALSNFGIVHLNMGNHTKALEVLQRALVETKAIGDRAGIPRALLNIGDSYRHLGKHDKAMSYARQSLEKSSMLTIGLGEEEVLGLKEEARHRADLGVVSALELLSHPSADKAALAMEAFWFVESSRGTHLLELLVNRNALQAAQLPQELQRDLASARAQEESARKILLSILSRSAQQNSSSNSQHEHRLSFAKKNLEEAYAQRRETIGRIQREQRRVADIIFPEAIDYNSFQTELQADTVFVSYYLAAEKIAALVVTHEAIHLFDLGDPALILARVNRYSTLLGGKQRTTNPEAGALYDALLRPLEAPLKGKKSILFSTDGVLAFLPFESLIRTDDHGNPQWLVELWEVSYVPSATALEALRRDAREQSKGSGLLALGDPLYSSEDDGEKSAAVEASYSEAQLRNMSGNTRLIESGREIREIGQFFPAAQREILLRKNASVSSLKNALNRTKKRLASIHFACHGRFHQERPYLTGLILAENEVLSLDDVYLMDVPADLAVLSACSSGEGKFERGEGVIGLVRGFFFAGAPRVVVSNWKVEDAATADFMIKFYRKMFQDGIPVGEALRQTKLDQLRAGGERAHPYYWAPFVLWGLPE